MLTLLQLLEDLAHDLRLDFDRARAKQALQQSEIEVPGSVPETWVARLKFAAPLLGMRVDSVVLSTRDVLPTVRAGMPVVARRGWNTDTPWLILVEARGGSGRVAGNEQSSKSKWLSASRIANILGAENSKQPLEWITVQPAFPGDAARSESSLKHHHDDHDEAHHAHITPFQRLWRLLKVERRDIVTVIWFALGISLLMLASPIAVEALVNTVAFGRLFQPLLVLAIILASCLALAAALRGLQTYVVEIIQRRIFVRVLADLSFRLPRVGLNAFDQKHGPELVNRFFDVLTVQKVSAVLLLEGFTAILTTLVGLIVVAFYHPVLLAFDIVLVIAILFVIFGLGRGAVRTSIAESRAKYAVVEWLEELARHPIAFKLSGGPDLAIDRADRLARDYLTARSKHFNIVLRQIIGSLALQVLTSTALLALGGWLVIEGQLTLGQLVAAELILAVVVASFVKLGKQLDSFYDLLAALEKVGHLLDLPLERDNGDTHPQESPGAELRLNGVSFAYNPRRPVLQGFNLVVQPGERVAVAGPSGCGKSTLVDLLFGLRLPTAGTIELDGVPLREIRLDVVRQQIATVKRIEIFDGTVEDNLRMGRDYLLLSDMRAALDAVGLYDDICGLPDGLQTQLTTGGAPLSYGQALRLVLARAIVAKPRLLVLDETLDVCDAELTAHLVKSILGKHNAWSVLLITHREDIMEHCDRVVRLNPRGPLNPSEEPPDVSGDGDGAVETSPRKNAGKSPAAVEPSSLKSLKLIAEK